MSKPVLYVFAISHYCEKARWALEYLGVEYEIRYLAPGIHRRVAKKLGAAGTSLPMLQVEGQVLQGSAEILDWAEARTAKSLTPDASPEDCREIEKRLDDVTGVHTRRYYYSEALVDHPKTVRPIFTRDIPLLHKLMVSWKWKLIRTLMIKAMDLGPAQFEDSKRILEGELDWLDGLLADGQGYLVGDRLSRADITAASLLAPLARPEQHPTYAGLSLPPRLSAQVAAWERRPTLGWVRDIYARYR